MNIDSVAYQVIGAALSVHKELGAGFLEKVYENALMIELEEQGLTAQQQYHIPVYYKGQWVGEYYADLFVEDCLIVELKATQELHPIHEVQLVNYLNGVELDSGLLLNFGKKLVYKRKYRHYRPPGSFKT